MKWGIVFVLAVSAAVLVPGFGAHDALDTREARDLEVARELVVSREALSPVYEFEPRFEKPLLAYAPDVVVMLQRLWDPVPGSRAWRVVAAGMLVLLTAAAGARHLGGRAGVCAAAVLSSSLGLIFSARVDGTQMLATLLAWVGATGFADALFGRRAGLEGRLVVAYAALATTLVIAGPLPALWPFGAAAIYLALTRRPRGWRDLRLGPGLTIMVGLGLPWYTAMTERYGAAFLSHAPFFPYAMEPRAPWFLGPFLAVSFVVVGMFPWSALLPGALRHAATLWRRPPAGVAPNLAPLARELSEERASHWFVACAIASLVPVLFYPLAPLSAVLPALPAAALLCGRLLDHAIEDQSRVAEPMLRATQLLSMLGTVATILLLLVAGRLRDGAPALRLLATVVFATSWLPFLAGVTGRHRLAALLMVLPVAVGAPVAGLKTLPALRGYLGTHDLGAAANRVMPPNAPLVLFEEPPPSLRLEAHRNLVQADWLDNGVAAARATDGYVYAAFRPPRETEIRTRLARSLGAGVRIEVLVRTPSLILARAGN